MQILLFILLSFIVYVFTVKLMGKLGKQLSDKNTLTELILMMLIPYFIMVGSTVILYQYLFL